MRTPFAPALLAALVSLAPASRTAAQEPPPASGPAPAATSPAATAGWNLGGGITTQVWTTFSTGVTLPAAASIPSAPGVTASLERRLGPSAWLTIGVDGSFRQQRSDAPPAGDSGLTRADVGAVAVALGIRKEVTRAGAPVTVSIVTAATGAWSREEDRWVNALGATSVAQTLRGWRAGGELGLAIDRELTEGLSLRVATPLVVASYGEGRVDLDGASPRRGHELAVGVTIAPSLELRVAF